MVSKVFKKNLIKFWHSIVFWAIAMFLFGVFRFFGILSQDGIQIRPGYENSIDPNQVLPLFILAGTLIGIMFAVIEILFDRYSSKRIPLGFALLVKTLVHFVAVSLFQLL